MPASCLHALPQPAVCEACARDELRKRAVRRGLAVAGSVVAVVGGLVVYLQTRPGKAAPPPRTKSDELEQYKRERLVTSPCSREANIDLVTHLMQREKWQPALDVGVKFITACPDGNPMREYLEYGYKQIGQWKAAVDQDTALITSEPTASDYWWWRGEAYALGDWHEVALVDYRQSIALNNYWNPRGTAAARMLASAETLKVPCEADRAWSWFVLQRDAKRSEEAYNLHAYLQRNHTCDAERGVGRGTLAIDKKLASTVDGAKGELVVDIKAGTTILSREYADRAGIKQLSDRLATTQWSGVALKGYPARAAKITIGAFSATNVEVVISDDMAIGDDGVLGFSFLWHFDWRREDDQRVRLAPLAN